MGVGAVLGGGVGGVTGDWKTGVGLGLTVLAAPYGRRLLHTAAIKHGFGTPTVKFGSSIQQQLAKFPGLHKVSKGETPSLGLSIKKIGDKEFKRLELKMKNPDHISNRPETLMKRHPETGKLILTPKPQQITRELEPGQLKPEYINENIRRRSAEAQKAARDNFKDPNITQAYVKVGFNHRFNKPILENYRDYLGDVDQIADIPEKVFKSFMRETSMSESSKLTYKQLRYFGEEVRKLDKILKAAPKDAPIHKTFSNTSIERYVFNRLKDKIKRSKGKKSHEAFATIENRIQYGRPTMLDTTGQSSGYVPGETEREIFQHAGTGRAKNSEYYRSLLDAAEKGGQTTTPPIGSVLEDLHKGANTKFMRETTGKPLGRPKGSKNKK